MIQEIEGHPTSSELDIFLLRDVLTLWGTLPQETYQENLELGSDTQPEIITETGQRLLGCHIITPITEDIH